MDVKIKKTNTTEASTTLSHADIVSILGLAVMIQAGIARDLPGTAVTVSLVPIDGSDQFTAVVDVVVDHNAQAAPDKAPEPVPVAADQSAHVETGQVDGVASSIQIPTGLGAAPTA